MKVALNVVFPNTFHRLCKWHITHEMGDQAKIGNVYRDKVAMERFHQILNYSPLVDAFEKSWD